MVDYKEYIKKQFIGKKIHFTSDCVIRMDVTGRVIDTEIVGSEILYIIDTGTQITKVGENTPKLKIEFL